MASTCCQPPSATLLGCAACFNLSPVNTPGLMDDRRFQGLSAVSQSLSSGCTVDPSEKAEISDSDDDDLPSVRKIIARSKQVIDLTLDDNDDSDSDNNTIETASSLLTYPPPRPTILVAKVTCTHRRRSHNVACSGHTYWEEIPLENVPPWSPLRHKLQQHSTTPLYSPTLDTFHAGSDGLESTLTEPEPPQNELRVLAAKLPEISPEIPGTPAAALENIRREQDGHSNDGAEDYNGRTQTVNGGKHPCPFVFDVFIEDDDVPIYEMHAYAWD